MAKRGHGEGSIFQRSDGRWCAYITLGNTLAGTQKKRWVYGKNQKEVQRKLRLLLQLQAESRLPTGDTMTVAELMQAWLEHNHTRWADKTREMYQGQVKHHINPRLGKVRLKDLTLYQIDAMHQDIARAIATNAKSYSSGERTAAMCRARMQQALKLATRWQLIARNPMQDSEPPPVRENEVVPLTPDEVRRVIAAVEHHRFRALFHIAFTTGLRRGELLGLRWADLTGSALTIRQAVKLVAGKPVVGGLKTAHSRRRLPLTAKVVLELETRLTDRLDERAVALDTGEWQDNDLIFANFDGSPYNPYSLRNLWRRLAAKAGVRSGTRLHDVRHTYASMMIRAGIDPVLLAARLGHSNPAFTLRRYAHIFDETRDAFAYDLDDLLGHVETPKIDTYLDTYQPQNDT